MEKRKDYLWVIILKTIIPMFLFTIILGIILTSREVREVRDLSNINKIIVSSKTVSSVVHELQKERGLSAGFVSSRGGVFATDIVSQREFSDSAISSLLKLKYLDSDGVNKPIKDQYDIAIDNIKRLDNMREMVSSLNATIPELAEYYTSTILSLLSIIEISENITPDGEITKKLSCYTSFLQAKEKAGLERAMGAAGFSNNGFKLSIYNKFVSLIAKQDTYLSNFKLFASSNIKSEYEKITGEEAFVKVEEYRDVAIKSIETDSLNGITGKIWFSTITKKIDLLKTVEDRIVDEIIEYSNIEIRKAFIKMITFILISFAIFLLSSVMIFKFINRSKDVFTYLLSVIDSLSAGNYDISINSTTLSQETVSIGDALEVFRKKGIEQKLIEAKQQELIDKQLVLEKRDKSLQEENARVLKDEAHGHLKGVVDISLKTNNAMSSIASLFLDLSKVSDGTMVISSAVEEMSVTINEINVTSTVVADNSLDAVKLADDGELITGRLVTDMDEIYSSVDDTRLMLNKLVEVSSSIADMVETIDDISSQTNLLALNATIEAARAGEAGKGFSVVASEVKGLAQQTSKVTTVVRENIDRLKTDISSIVKSMNRSSDTVTKGKETITVVKSSMGDIHSKISEVSTMMQSVSDLLEQQTSAVSEISEQSSEINDEVIHTKSLMEEVLDNLGNAMDSVEHRISIFQNLNTNISTIELAKNDHSKFKNRILNTILNRDSWQSSEVPDFHKCRLGKWYNSNLPQSIKSSKQYKDLEDIHENVHKVTREILSSFENGDSEAAINNISVLDKLSVEVIDKLSELEKLV